MCGRALSSISSIVKFKNLIFKIYYIFKITYTYICIHIPIHTHTHRTLLCGLAGLELTEILPPAPASLVLGLKAGAFYLVFVAVNFQMLLMWIMWFLESTGHFRSTVTVSDLKLKTSQASMAWCMSLYIIGKA